MKDIYNLVYFARKKPYCGGTIYLPKRLGEQLRYEHGDKLTAVVKDGKLVVVRTSEVVKL